MRSAGSGTGTSTTVLVDRSSVTAGPLGALGAPKTPTGLRSVLMNQTSVWLAANFNAPEDGVIGYRLYAKQRVAGATSASTGWQFQGESTTPTWADGTGCDTYIDYRVTAIRKLTPASADTVESLPSMPIRVKTPACP